MYNKDDSLFFAMDHLNYSRWLPVYIMDMCHLQEKALNVYVVVNFLSQVIFVFLLFLGMVIYANEVETKEK